MVGSNYIIPIELLEKQSDYNDISNDDIEGIKRDILTVLNKLGIEVERMESIVSPSIITIEAIPSQGYKLSKIRKYAEAIERGLKELGICRVIIPVPGRNAFALEMPRSCRRMVCLREVLESSEFKDSKAILPIALGISTENEPIIADLSKMPHLLIGGAIGSGKSVLLHSIIVSLLYKMRPDELKFVLIDTKKVEFTNYAGISNRYLVKIEGIVEDIITETKNVISTLNSLCAEMDNRYELLIKASCRSIREYNQKIRDRNLLETGGYSIMPYLIVVIDEFADLIIRYGKVIESPIARIAQKCRALGIHMIISTQQLSTQVITGIIKANFPARIAFKVNSISDSRTILDMTGAQMLMGCGDMLRTDNGWISRIQGAFVGSQDIERVCDWIARNNPDNGAFIISSPPISEDSYYNPCNDEGTDPLFEEAAISVIQSGAASMSALQRRYSIGYNRACRIMDQLEQAGIVGPACSGKPRKILLNGNYGSQEFPFPTNRFWKKITQFCKGQKKETDKNNESRDMLFEEVAVKIVSSDIDNIINWKDYYISGDIDEIKKIARIPGIINIGVDDIISTLSTTNTNYVVSGKGTGPKKMLIALNNAVAKLPVKLQDIEKMIVNIWTKRCRPVEMQEIKTLVEHLGDTMSELSLIWGVAVDPNINDADIKITLVAVNKNRLC